MAVNYDTKSGQNYAPKSEMHKIVCTPGEFIVGVSRIDHGHIYGMCNGLKEAGAEIKYIYDPDPQKVEKFVKAFPSAQVMESEDALIAVKEMNLVCTSGIPNERYLVGLKALAAGKDFFSDKAAFTTQEQCDKARSLVKKTGLKWFVYFGERLHVEAAIYAAQLIEEGRIGRVLSIKGWGPHKIGNEGRPDWFYKKEQYGGIITDVGSHQLEQALYYAGAKDATYISSRVGNLANPDTPELEDYGDAMFITDNGIPCYISVDWYTPLGLCTWGDGRMFICGTKGYIEMRKYCDVAATTESDHVIVVDEIGENHYRVHGRIGYPFFGQLIRDCLDRTEIAINQEHTFRAMELAIEAEEKAVRIK